MLNVILTFPASTLICVLADSVSGAPLELTAMFLTPACV